MVASALAFHPPEPYYLIEKKKGESEEYDSYSLSLSSQVHNVPFPGLQVTMIPTKTKNTEIPILFFPTMNAKFTIIYSHGNATDIGAMYTFYIALARQLEVNVIAYDYTGYGPTIATHSPTEKQIYKDIEAVYDWAVKTKVVQDASKEIILYGQSVGSGPTCYLASRRGKKKKPVAGVILASGILSGVRVLTPSRLLACFDIFPNISRIQRVKCPVFVIHGEEDQEVPIHHGHGLHEKVPSRHQTSPWWVPQRGHNDLLLGNEDEFFRRMKRFLQTEIHTETQTQPVETTALSPTSKTNC